MSFMFKLSKGVLLCGGNGTRLRPLTFISNKHLLPVYNKPMILYPLETLKAMGIKDILIISGGENIGSFTEFLGDGTNYGVRLTYRVQKDAGGIAEALGLARQFIGDDASFSVILGDNIFENTPISIASTNEMLEPHHACIFLKEVPDPERFGVPIFDGRRIVGIEEKPKIPKSKYAVTGLYCYPNEVFNVIETLSPSARGEKEITDVNNYFVARETLDYITLPLEYYWSDAGTFDSLLNSSNWAKGN